MNPNYVKIEKDKLDEIGRQIVSRLSSPYNANEQVRVDYLKKLSRQLAGRGWLNENGKIYLLVRIEELQKLKYYYENDELPF